MTPAERAALLDRAMQAVADDELAGFCIRCGEEHDGLLELDARKIQCAHCDALAVYGAEEILIVLG